MGVNADEVPLDKSFLDEFTDKLFPGMNFVLTRAKPNTT